MTVDQLLNSGGVLRHSPAQGFYVVRQGVAIPIDQKEAEEAVRQKRVRPEGGGPDKHGVWHFAINKTGSKK